MYVPEGMCMAGQTGNASQGARWAILSTMMDIIIPRNNILIKPSLPPYQKKKRDTENLELNIFCSMTLFKKMINYGDISKKLISGTFTSSSLFSNSSNLRGNISYNLFHCQTQRFFGGGRKWGLKLSSKNDVRGTLKL